MIAPLEPANIPVTLHPLISLAESFGIEDDDRRREAIHEIGPERLAKLRKTVEEYEPFFDEWLAGPEADDDEQSEEYVAFTFLRIAAEGH